MASRVRQLAGLLKTLNDESLILANAPFGVLGDGSDETAKIQSAIDALPAIGGRLIVPPGDFDWLDPNDLTVPVNKMITWIDPSNSLPAGMRGAVELSGLSSQPHEGGLGSSTRPGAKHIFLKSVHSPDPAQVNQQDSIVYIEGFEPDVDLPLDNEFAGLRINMSSEATDATASLRALHMTATGVGGSAKVRAMRLIAIGLNGHDGLLVGGLATAARTGLIPTSAGGDGTATYASGDYGPFPNEDQGFYITVGPGIRRGLLIGGQEGKERPQVGIQQARGAQALLPGIAVIDLHGGGAGHLVRVLRDEEDATEIARWERSGKFASPAFRSNLAAISIADDAVATITPAVGNGVIEVQCDNALDGCIEVKFRTTAGGGAGAGTPKFVGASAALGTTGVTLTGTTGADGKMTVSVVGNTIMIENRLGATRNFTYTIRGQ
jgi:hypothetical protein